jgi:hypothetical protein
MKENMGDDGETQVDLVSYPIKTRKPAQDSTNWLIDGGTCEYRWGAQYRRFRSYQDCG